MKDLYKRLHARKNNAVNHVETVYGKGFGVPEVIRTPDLSLRSKLYRIFQGVLSCSEKPYNPHNYEICERFEYDTVLSYII